MMKNLKRWAAVGLAVSVAAIGLEAAAPMVAGATQVDLACTGITGDNASSLGDSKATLALLATVGGGGGGGLAFSAEITTDAPAKTTPSSGPFTANFDLTLTLPESLLKPAKELLKLDAVEVKNATYGIVASGAADASLTTVVPSQVISFASSPVVVRQRVSGTIDPKRAGGITYTAGNTKLTIVINKAVAGVQINELTVNCGSSKDIATTSVQIPGAPIVAGPIYQLAYTANVVGQPLIGTKITPDSGNPLIPNSLKVARQAPNGGYSVVGGGASFFLAPRETGFYTVNYDVCAASKIVPEVPGVNTVQTMAFPAPPPVGFPNPHAIAMTLQFKGAKSAPIPLSVRPFFGGPSPTNAKLLEVSDTLFGTFVAPSAAQIQAALESISTIGKGNVTVGGNGATGYTITFVNALGLSEQPKVDVVDFVGWLPAEVLTGALAALNPPKDPNAPTPPPPETLQTLDAKLAAGTIDLQGYVDGRLKLFTSDLIAGFTTPQAITAITALFPKAPEFAVATNGKATVPQAETGPLCTGFNIGYLVIPAPAAVLAATSTRTVTKCSYKRVKVKGKSVKKRVCTKVAVKAATTKR